MTRSKMRVTAIVTLAVLTASLGVTTAFAQIGGRMMRAPAWGPYVSEDEELPVVPAEGVLVVAVLADSPAQRAGIVRGDAVLSVAGQDVSLPADVYTAIADKRAGETVEVVITRGGSERTVRLTLETRVNRPLIGMELLPDRARLRDVATAENDYPVGPGMGGGWMPQRAPRGGFR